MSSYRCSTCGIHYPTSERTSTGCPVHKETMDWSQEEPDEDWYEQSLALKRHLVRAQRAEGLFPVIPEVPVTEKQGRYFVSTWDIHGHDGVPSTLTEGALLQIGEDVFEIQGRIESMRMYYMRLFQIECPNTVRECFPPKRRRKRA